MANVFFRRTVLALFAAGLLFAGCSDESTGDSNGDETDTGTEQDTTTDTGAEDTSQPEKDTAEPRDTIADTKDDTGGDTTEPEDIPDTTDAADTSDVADTADIGPTRLCDENVSLGQNAIANGGGEADMGSDGEVIEVTCWDRTEGCFTVMNYEDGYGGFQNVKPPNAGDNLLAGGRSCSDGNGTSIGIQSLETELVPIAGDIASGSLEYELSGQLGGWEDQDDSATIEVRFFDGAGNELDSDAIGPITADDRNGETKFLERTTSGTVPMTTSSIDIVMEADKTGSSNNDGVADNLELVFSR